MAPPKNSPAKISCVIYVEGKQTLLLSLKQVLEPAFEVVAMADNALSLVDAITTLAPALVVVDMGGPTGVSSIVRHVRHRFRESVLVVIVDDLDVVTQRQAQSWGVQGVVIQSRVAEELCSVSAKALHEARQTKTSRLAGETHDVSSLQPLESPRASKEVRRRSSRS